MLSIATDYLEDKGCPEPHLRHIAEAGFSHVHWCHQWNTDFLYSRSEIDQIRRWLSELGLSVLDIHASAGTEKDWCSEQEYERMAGVELVENRMKMAAHLSADVIVLHARARASLDHQLSSLEALQQKSRPLGVRIAFENLPDDDLTRIQELLERFEPGFVGFCYDSGHAHIGGQDLAVLTMLRERLIATHLHDNDGTADQHRLPFTASVPWRRVAAALAGSGYRKCVNLEVSMKAHDYTGEGSFLRASLEAGHKLAEMIRTSTL